MGFILTKWYVNITSFSPSDTPGISFILTKWYVNLEVALVHDTASFILTSYKIYNL